MECKQEIPVYDLYLNQGQTTTIGLEFADGDGNPIDITNDTFEWNLKDNVDSDTYLIQATNSDVINSRIVISDQTTSKGEATLIISGNDTASLTPKVTDVQNLRWVDSNGEPTFPFKGIFVLKPSV